MRVLGIVFAGTAQRPQMTAFARDVLGMTPAQVTGVEADLFDLPDGSSFAVASPQGMGATDRSVGFLVDDIDVALLPALPRAGRASLRARGAARPRDLTGSGRVESPHPLARAAEDAEHLSGPCPVLPNQCGIAVSNSAPSPATRTESLSPRISRTRPDRT